MENIVIFGASVLGEIAYNILKKKYNICFFCDNDTSKWGKVFFDKLILSPNELTNYQNYSVVIASMYYTEISKQLRKLKIEKLYIFNYCDVNDTTYSKRYEITPVSSDKNYENIHIDKELKQRYKNDFFQLYNNSRYEQKIYKIRRDNNNILILAYIFPPIAGSGVQRTLKFVKYLKELGYTPTVLTVGRDYISEPKDSSLLNEVTEDINIIRIDHAKVNAEQLTKKEILEISYLICGLVEDNKLIDQFCKSLKIDKRNLEIPEDKIFWINDVLKYIQNKININDFKYVYTTSAPYSSHVAGYYIKNKYSNVTWIADFRDEWSNNPYVKDRESLKYKIEYAMEKSILNKADKIIQVTPISTENCQREFGVSKTKVFTITNGYDESDFKDIGINIKNSNKKFIITFSGTVYNNMVVENFFKAVNKLIEDGIIDKGEIELKYYGRYLENTKEKIMKFNKYNIIKIEGYVSHTKCIVENSKSNMLLLPIGCGKEFRQVYTGKVFEYIRIHIPILALAPTDGVVSKLLEETKAGKTFEFSDLIGIKNYILQNFIMWKNGEKYNDFDYNEIKKYERKELTKKLINIIES